jgi:hypothetical protein
MLGLISYNLQEHCRINMVLLPFLRDVWPISIIGASCDHSSKAPRSLLKIIEEFSYAHC